MADIAPVMSEWLAEDCAVVIDGHSSYQAASRNLNLHQETVRVSRREFRRGSWHLNTVNQRHMTMKRLLNPSPSWRLYALPGSLPALVDEIGIQGWQIDGSGLPFGSLRKPFGTQLST